MPASAAAAPADREDWDAGSLLPDGLSSCSAASFSSCCAPTRGVSSPSPVFSTVARLVHAGPAVWRILPPSRLPPLVCPTQCDNARERRRSRAVMRLSGSVGGSAARVRIGSPGVLGPPSSPHGEGAPNCTSVGAQAQAHKAALGPSSRAAPLHESSVRRGAGGLLGPRRAPWAHPGALLTLLRRARQGAAPGGALGRTGGVAAGTCSTPQHGRAVGMGTGARAGDTPNQDEWEGCVDLRRKRLRPAW